MSPNRGTLLFAFDNDKVSYTNIALCNKKRIENHYKHPVVIVSDKKIDDTTIVIEDSHSLYSYDRHYKNIGVATFKNTSRCTAFDITPFEETILLDVDLIINTSIINRLWTGDSLKVSKTAYDITGRELPRDVLTISEDSLKMYWATIVCFSKIDPLSKEFFRSWKDVVKNYLLYRSLFGLPNILRNDFAVSIALYKLSGYTDTCQVNLPFSIPTAFEETKVKIYANSFSTKLNGANLPVFSDLHIINKESLENDF